MLFNKKLKSEGKCVVIGRCAWYNKIKLIFVKVYAMYQDYSQNQYYAPAWLDAKRTFSRFGLALAAFFIAAYAVIFAAEVVLMLFFPAAIENPVTLAVLNAVSMYVIAFPVYYIIIFRLERRARMRLPMKAREFIGFFCVAQLFMLVGARIGDATSGIVGRIFGTDPNNATSDMITSWPMPVILVTVVIIGPLFEELIFRKLMIDRLSIYGDKIAIIVSAVAFGLFHGNLFQFFYSMMLGLLLGYMYVKTGKMRYPYLMHAVINFFGSIVPLSIQPYLEELQELVAKTELNEVVDMSRYATCTLVVFAYLALQLIFVLAGAIILLKNLRRIRIDPYRRVDIPKGTRFSTVALNIGAMLYLLVCCAIFAMSLFLV